MSQEITEGSIVKAPGGYGKVVYRLAKKCYVEYFDFRLDGAKVRTSRLELVEDPDSLPIFRCRQAYGSDFKLWLVKEPSRKKPCIVPILQEAVWWVGELSSRTGVKISTRHQRGALRLVVIPGRRPSGREMWKLEKALASKRQAVIISAYLPGSAGRFSGPRYLFSHETSKARDAVILGLACLRGSFPYHRETLVTPWLPKSVGQESSY